MANPRYTCPRCAGSVVVGPDKLGKTIACPECGAHFRLPAPGECPPTTPEPPTAEPPPDADADDRMWYHSAKGQRTGPLHTRQMRDLIGAGTLDNNTLVWCNDYADWVPLGTTILRTAQVTPPALPGAAVRNELVWVLAFVPIWGAMVENMVAALSGSSSSDLWVISVVLNVVFGYSDSAMLKRAGYKTDAFGGWAWLVPVYLYKRAQALGQPLSYFICWLCAFGMSVIFYTQA
jgi:hypothetical protein